MKQKTKKAAKKRFHISASGKVRRRRTHQAHFNARATGNETRHKHRDEEIAPSDRRRVARLLPNS